MVRWLYRMGIIGCMCLFAILAGLTAQWLLNLESSDRVEAARVTPSATVAAAPTPPASSTPMLAAQIAAPAVQAATATAAPTVMPTATPTVMPTAVPTNIPSTVAVPTLTSSTMVPAAGSQNTGPHATATTISGLAHTGAIGAQPNRMPRTAGSAELMTSELAVGLVLVVLVVVVVGGVAMHSYGQMVLFAEHIAAQFRSVGAIAETISQQKAEGRREKAGGPTAF